MSFLTTTTSANGPVVPEICVTADPLRSHVAQIIGHESYLPWTIVQDKVFETKDGNKHLVLIDVDPKVAPDLIHLRGIIVDVDVEVILATSQGYTDTAVSDGLMADGGDIALVDTDEKYHLFPAGEYTAYYALDGAVVRLFWYGGKLFVATHRAMWLYDAPQRSRWGSGPTFHEMIELCGVPPVDELFDTSVMNSDTCHLFLLCHPSLNVSSRVSGCFCVHVESFAMSLKSGTVSAPGKIDFAVTEDLPLVVADKTVYRQRPLSLDEMNNHLLSGFFNPVPTADPRITTGESIMLFRRQAGTLLDVVRVYSTAAYHRMTLRGNNANPVHQFHALISYALPPLDSEAAHRELWSRFASLRPYSEEQVLQTLQDFGAVHLIPVEFHSDEWLSSVDNRIHMVWLNMILAMAPEKQPGFATAFSDFKRAREQLVNWLIELEQSPTPIHTLGEEYGRCKSLIKGARDAAGRQKQRAQRNVSVAEFIRNFVFREKGPSVYKMVRLMRGENAKNE